MHTPFAVPHFHGLHHFHACTHCVGFSPHLHFSPATAHLRFTGWVHAHATFHGCLTLHVHVPFQDLPHGCWFVLLGFWTWVWFLTSPHISPRLHRFWVTPLLRFIRWFTHGSRTLFTHTSGYAHLVHCTAHYTVAFLDGSHGWVYTPHCTFTTHGCTLDHTFLRSPACVTAPPCTHYYTAPLHVHYLLGSRSRLPPHVLTHTRTRLRLRFVTFSVLYGCSVHVLLVYHLAHGITRSHAPLFPGFSLTCWLHTVTPTSLDAFRSWVLDHLPALLHTRCLSLLLTDHVLTHLRSPPLYTTHVFSFVLTFTFTFLPSFGLHTAPHTAGPRSHTTAPWMRSHTAITAPFSTWFTGSGSHLHLFHLTCTRTHRTTSDYRLARSTCTSHRIHHTCHTTPHTTYRTLHYTHTCTPHLHTFHGLGSPLLVHLDPTHYTTCCRWDSLLPHSSRSWMISISGYTILPGSALRFGSGFGSVLFWNTPALPLLRSTLDLWSYHTTVLFHHGLDFHRRVTTHHLHTFYTHHGSYVHVSYMHTTQFGSLLPHHHHLGLVLCHILHTFLGYKFTTWVRSGLVTPGSRSAILHTVLYLHFGFTAAHSPFRSRSIHHCLPGLRVHLQFHTFVLRFSLHTRVYT